MRKVFRFLVFLLSISIFGQTASGNIETYIDNIIDNVPNSSSNVYTSPNTTQLSTWNTVINFLVADDLASARTNANGLGYQVTEFTDTSISPNKIFYVLEKQSVSSNYWGTYVFNKTPHINNLIIQAPHIKNDINTGHQAVYCFKNTLARAVFISGTHRCNSNSYSSCSGSTSTCSSSSESYRISDLAHNVTTMFQKTTENLLTNIPNSVFVQLHGFGKRSTDPYVILSNGTRITPTTDYATLIKEALLKEDNSLTFKIAHIDTDWTRLIGFTNTQGRLINNSTNHCSFSATTTTGRFVHIEQEKSKLRNDSSGWAKMSNALKEVFPNTLSITEYNLNNKISVSPNPTSKEVVIKAKQISKVEVFNLFGQRILSKKFNKVNNPSINLINASSGIYLFKIKTSNGFALKKVIRL